MDMDYNDRKILLDALNRLTKYNDKTISKKENQIFHIGAKNIYDILVKNFHKVHFTKFDISIIITALGNYSDFLSKSAAPVSDEKLQAVEKLLEEYQYAYENWNDRERNAP